MRVGRLLLLIGVCFPSLLAAQSSQKTALPEQTAQTPQPAAREQFLSYWTTEPGWNTELLLRNNLESEQLTVVPAVRTSTGIETALPSVTIKPGDVASLDLDNVLINAAPQLLGSWGSLVLRYSSIAHRALYASVMIRGTGRPIVFHLDAFERGSRYETGSREGIWWLPWESTTGYLILTNSGDDSLQPTLTLYDAGGRTAQQSLVIPPRQSQRLSVRDVVEQSGLTGSFGGIQIKMTKGARYLDSVHLLFEASGIFSAVMKMFKHDPAVTLASRSFGGATEWTTRAPMLALSNPDPALRLPAGTVLQPKVFVRNASSNAVTAHIGFNWRSATTNGKSVPFNLPLGPNQTQVVDVADLQAQKLLPTDAYWASVILSAPVQPNDLLAVAASHDSTGRYGAQTPFSDQLASHWEGGKWEVDATHDSLVTVANGGKQTAQAQLTILYNQGAGQYQIERTLAPGEQMALDFAELIRDAVPDKNGNVLPSGLTSGTYRLLDLADNPLGGLYEGKVIVDKTWGHATYTCMICCGPDTPWMTYSPLDLLLNGNFLQSVQAVNSCNGHLSTITSDFPTWWTGNSAIATATGHQINGVGVGSTNHYAQSINMYWGPLEDDPSCPLSQETPTAPTVVAPVIASISPTWGTVGTNVAVSITGQGFGSAPTIVFSGSGISPTYGSRGDTSISATFAIATTAPVGFQMVQVQNNTTPDGSKPQSNAVNFQVAPATATPVNFHIVSEINQSDGSLYFTYSWSSSTGTQSDLNSCTVGESVYYPNYPSTPYIWPLPMAQSTPNPTVLSGSATNAGFYDTNGPPSNYQTPYSSAGFTATQRFWWSCTNYNSGATQALYPDAIIARQILNNIGWKYQITKQGYTNTHNLP